MARDVIPKDGEEIDVNEDTAKAYRLVRWEIITGLMCLALMAVLFIALLWVWTAN